MTPIVKKYLLCILFNHKLLKIWLWLFSFHTKIHYHVCTMFKGDSPFYLLLIIISQIILWQEAGGRMLIKCTICTCVDTDRLTDWLLRRIVKRYHSSKLRTLILSDNKNATASSVPLSLHFQSEPRKNWSLTPKSKNHRWVYHEQR